MPKKKDAPAADAATTAPAEAKEAKQKKADATVFKHTGNEPTCKLPPQATGIVNILKEAGKAGLSRTDLVAAMDGVVTTKQPMGRILSYYQKKLVESGAVEMIEPAE